MIPTYLTAALILPGLYMEDGRPPNFLASELWDECKSGGFLFVDSESKAIYSLDRKKNVTLDEIQIDENNFLTETLVVAVSIQGISFERDCHNSNSTNWIDNGDNFDMLLCEENMEGIAEIAKSNYDDEFKNANSDPERYSWWLEKKIFHCSFVALWETHMSQGYFDPHPELDAI
jgi:hypothetical protein